MSVDPANAVLAVGAAALAALAFLESRYRRRKRKAGWPQYADGGVSSVRMTDDAKVLRPGPVPSVDYAIGEPTVGWQAGEPIKGRTGWYAVADLLDETGELADTRVHHQYSTRRAANVGSKRLAVRLNDGGKA